MDLFRRMRAGEFQEGEKTLRAKIDLASPNMNIIADGMCLDIL